MNLGYVGTRFGSDIKPCVVCGAEPKHVTAHVFEGDDGRWTEEYLEKHKVAQEYYPEEEINFYCTAHYPFNELRGDKNNG